ncbi:MAG: response regulator transcription factor [Acidobacteria bacterium]|nr:MAG: response regulator transcription factor [Acidobacteriota bacterium]
MRVLLGKAERRTALFWARALREDAHAVDRVASLAAVLSAAQAADYAALVLDTDLEPEMSPVGVRQHLRAHQVNLPVLFLLPAAGHAAAIVEEQAEGDRRRTSFLREPFRVSELRARLRHLVYGAGAGAGASASRTRAVAGVASTRLMLDPQSRCARHGTVEIELTRKEYALLELLLLRAPRPATHADIATHLWDRASVRDSNLIEVYVARLRRRLQRATGEALLQTVRGVGYRIGPEEA